MTDTTGHGQELTEDYIQALLESVTGPEQGPPEPWTGEGVEPWYSSMDRLGGFRTDHMVREIAELRALVTVLNKEQSQPHVLTEEEIDAAMQAITADMNARYAQQPRICVTCGRRLYTQHQLETLPVSDEDYARFMAPSDCPTCSNFTA